MNGEKYLVRQRKENRFSESENGVVAQEIREPLDKGVMAESSYELLLG